jgi:hypothetical protein
VQHKSRLDDGPGQPLRHLQITRGPSAEVQQKIGDGEPQDTEVIAFGGFLKFAEYAIAERRKRHSSTTFRPGWRLPDPIGSTVTACVFVAALEEMVYDGRHAI